MSIRFSAVALCLLPLAASCIPANTTPQPVPQAAPSRVTQSMSDIAEHYVKLVLAVGEHDSSYVDAY